jgi:aspartate/methionine/tyrosine aminotransferase
MLSSRLPPDLAPNAVARAVDARRTTGADLLDLTASNPTVAGLHYPPDLLAPMASAEAIRYEPRALGLASAREAVAAEYARHGRPVHPGRIALTASTSEAYALLFKLLCDPGDEVLVPQPSYPLFDHLTRLEAVIPRAYHLEYHGDWRVDLHSVTRAVTSRTRALLVVSPNNPTGSFLHRHDLSDLVDVCRRHDLALIGDEVFFDYPLDPAPDKVSVLDQDEVVTCALGGLSKSCGLPQVKLGWMAWNGPAPEVARVIAAYEIVADSYLSVSTPVQVAAPTMLHRASTVRAQIQARIARNLQALRAACAAWPAVTVLRAEGGWSAVVQVPATRPEEGLVLTLITEDGVLVHPGYFFDFPREAYLVISLLVEPATFDTGISRVLARTCGSGR